MEIGEQEHQRFIRRELFAIRIHLAIIAVCALVIAVVAIFAASKYLGWL